ncbi:DUF3300 domain-containing protein [Paraburkholderia sp. UYCP14C]|uniref:DUF3300 domain-containing protein n=1 Tax=Paraburkholderia sp. UYCP14C TaxID=2511130 RepID=UPI0020070D53|nr:DUF3300 domain-containing protein [Paraburkholderia sp. UYCP14C]
MDRESRARARIIPFATAVDRRKHTLTFCDGPRRARRVSHVLGAALLACCGAFSTAVSLAQAPAADATANTAPSGAPIPAATLDKLVGPIALYPDDLIAIILPSATYPVEIVQADRFLDQYKNDKSLKLNDAWHDPVKALLNYPVIVKQMSTDLDWTINLGEAVVTDQGAVLEAIQRFRRQTQSAGHLKSDDKQTVVVEKEIIKIQPADPQVIYVPQYNPQTVVVASAPVTYAYAPAPYPAYYYPYAPGAALATGLIWGAAITAAWSGGHYVTHYGGGGNNNININRERNVERGDRTVNRGDRNVERGNINTGDINRGGGRGQGGGTSGWTPDKKPGQVSGISDRSARTQRVGDPPSRGGGAGGGASAGNLGGRGSGGGAAAGNLGGRGTGGAGGGAGANFAGGGAGGQARPQPSQRPTASAGTRDVNQRAAPSGGGNAFSGYGSARTAQADSARGAASRQSARSSGFSGGGGGGFSGGGGRGGGGGGFSPRAGGGGRGGGRR